MPRVRIAGIAGVLALAVALVSGFEGKSNQTYPDPISVPTICYGHTGPDVKFGEVKTDQQCVVLLEQDVKRVDAEVQTYVKVPLNLNQETALISLVYNIGEGNFSHSTLLRKLNAKDYSGAAKQFTRWSYSGGKQLPGLLSRRLAEQELFSKELK